MSTTPEMIYDRGRIGTADTKKIMVIWPTQIPNYQTGVKDIPDGQLI